jgi:DNA recombination protein RmuC
MLSTIIIVIAILVCTLTVVAFIEIKTAAILRELQQRQAIQEKTTSDLLSSWRENIATELHRQSAAMSADLSQTRSELTAAINSLRDTHSQALVALTQTTRDAIQNAATVQQQAGDVLRQGIDGKFSQIQALLASQLDSMRKTVDEKLQSTLERRIGESFKTVSEQLQAVQKGLGEMITVAESARDLKNVFMNIKSRGGMGELQLEAVLQNMLSPEQFRMQYAVNGGREKVDAVISLPGAESGALIMLPIDAKFPIADAQRLFSAQESGDAEAIKAARTGLENLIRREAKSISEKYIRPPETTDFAIMFLPSEALFAEAVRSPDLLDDCHRRHKVMIAGPASLWAVLSSLRMGFRTLAIQTRAAEVQHRLEIVRNEFGKFRGLLEKISKHIDSARDTLQSAEKQNRQLERSLDIQATDPDALLPPQ